MDAYSKYEQEIEAFWAGREGSNDGRVYWNRQGLPVPNYELLEVLLTKSLHDEDTARSGSLACGLDMWIAEELRAAGFDEEGVWPRLHEPRVIDPAVQSFISGLPNTLADECLQRMSKAGSSTAKVQGAVYEKQIDVGMSSWLTGPEILISTKTMNGAYGKNLANRFEEAYGDAMNLRRRYPLAAIGFFFLVNADITNNFADVSKAVSMLRKLQEEEGVYDSTALLLVDWSSGAAHVDVQAQHVPENLGVPVFFAKIIENAISHGPVKHHQRVREKAHAVDIIL